MMEKLINCILLVDDDDRDNFFHKRVIKKEGSTQHIRVVNNGLEALNYIQNFGEFTDKVENPRPNIIFLDINMPKMNGFEFLEVYKDLKAEICIIMLTTSRNPKDVEQANAIGEIATFISKPLTKDKLKEVIKEYIDIPEFPKENGEN